jgi:hypothetical protein
LDLCVGLCIPGLVSVLFEDDDETNNIFQHLD